MEEPVEEITEQSLLGNVPPVNAANVVNIPEEDPTIENKENKKNNNEENNKKNNKKNKNIPILYNAESEEIVYRNIQNLSPNNLYKETTRVFQNNPNNLKENNTNKTRFRHQRRKNKGRKTRKTRIRK